METPNLDQIILMGVEARLFDLHTCLPAVVEKYNKAKQTVDVTPALKRKYESGDLVTYPVILNVPVAFPRGGKFSITHPIKPGDNVLLIFSERSIDVWKKSGGIVDPNDPRKFNITDAFAIPGGYPENKPVEGASDTNVRIVNDKSLIEMTEDGKFLFKNKDTDDFLVLVSELLQAILDARTQTMLGPQPFDNLIIFQDIKNRLDAIRK